MTKKEEREAQGHKTCEKMWIISHTGVREAYEGKGIARELVLKVIEAARAKGVKVCPLCSYAKKLMTGKEAFKDDIIFVKTLNQGLG